MNVDMLLGLVLRGATTNKYLGSVPCNDFFVYEHSSLNTSLWIVVKEGDSSLMQLSSNLCAN
jgi:hypothetical protein